MFGLNGKSQSAELPQQLLSILYATVTDNSQWQVFCEKFDQLTDSPLMMFGHNMQQNQSMGIIAGGISESDLSRYHEHYADKNVWMHMNAVMPVGMVGLSDQALSQHDLFQTEFYNDWLKDLDNVVGGPAIICNRSTNRLAVMAACCRAKRYDDSVQFMEELFRFLGPHVTRAVELSEALSRGNSHSLRHLDGLAHGAILINQNGSVAYTNKAAETALTRTGALQIGLNGRLSSCNERIQKFLGDSIRAMQREDFSKCPPPLPLDFIGALETENTCILHPHIFPQSHKIEFPEAAWVEQIVGTIVITDQFGFADLSLGDRLVEAYGATAAETKLAHALMAGMSLSEFADANMVSQHTVRNQMRALLHKTKTPSQQAFLSLIFGLASPFRNTETF